jgi:hypothetical protein
LKFSLPLTVSLIPEKKKNTEIQAFDSLISSSVLLGSGRKPVIQIGGMKKSMEMMNTDPAQKVRIFGIMDFICSAVEDYLPGSSLSDRIRS